MICFLAFSSQLYSVSQITKLSWWVLQAPGVNVTISFTPSDLQCFDFSQEKLEKSLGEINPMVEFMPHSTSGSPYTLSHSSNYVTTTPSPAATDPLQYLLQSLNKMPVVNADIVDPSQSTLSTQRSLEKENETRPSPVPKSTGGIRSDDLAPNYQVAMRHYEDVVNTLFQSFKARYKKSYISKREHETRKDIYRHNLRLELPWLPWIRSFVYHIRLGV